MDVLLERDHICSESLVDAGDEFVCSICSSVTVKEIVDIHVQSAAGRTDLTRYEYTKTAESVTSEGKHGLDYTSYALGSFMGNENWRYDGAGERRISGFSKANNTFRYLKLVSDYTLKGDNVTYNCAKIVERVCDKLSLPRVVLGEAMRFVKSTMERKAGRKEWNSATISAFSVIMACKVHGVTSAGVRDIVEAHRALGHVVKNSTLNQMTFDFNEHPTSPTIARPAPRKAEEYLGRVVAHLPEVANLKECLQRRGYNELTYHHRLYEVAKKILSVVDASARGGHSPPAIAASAVYMAEIVMAKMDGNRRKFMTQLDAASCIGIAEYTVREQYGEMFAPRLENILSVIMGSL